jgi:alpha-amylase
MFTMLPQSTRRARKLFGGLLAATAATAFGFALPAHAAFNPPDTSVQLFEWSWNDIATECTQWLGPQGYGAVQISPPHASKVANGWWGVYQPVNYANLTSRMGTEAQLQTMINTCHTAGVRVYADIVVNQMADGSGTATDGSTWNANTLSFPFFSGLDFHPNCNINDSDYNSPAGQYNVQYCRLGGLPDLATEKTYVQQQIVTYLSKLIDMGVDGFRIDAAKHMQAGALQSIFNTLKSARPKTKAGENIWVTQEIINDGATNRGEYFPIGTLNEFQFTYAMRDVFRRQNGLSLSSVPTIMGTWGNWGGTWGFIQPQNATIFINNWDTERNGSSLNANNYTGAVNDTVGTQRYALANVFMLAQGYGEAQVQSGFRFSDHNADRPTASPYSGGAAQINVVWDFVHRWQPISNMVKLRAASAGQAQTNWTVGSADQVAFSRGNVAFVALNNTGAAWSRTFFTNLPAGTYCNVINGGRNAAGNACTGSSVTVDSNGNANITVPADGAQPPAVAIYTGARLNTTVTTPTSCAVTFSIANANTSVGQDVYVVGNQSAIGNWTPAAAYKLTIQGSGANATWRGTVNLPASTAVQYKYIKRNGSATVWESNQATGSGNREFVTCAGGASSGTQARNDGSFKF